MGKVIKGRQAEQYDAFMRKHSRNIELFNDFIKKNVKKNTRVCDFAAGTGIDVEILKDKVKEIVAIDLSKDMINICRKKFKSKNIKFKLASATDTKLPKGYFDYVIIRLGLHHIKEKEKVVDEAYRILKSNGRFIVIDKFYKTWFEYVYKAIKKILFEFRLGVFEPVVSKQKNLEVLTRKFKIIKKIYLPYDKKHTGQTFLFVLEKKTL
jgi:ubiquinone/menaquinone biosynthesis C-methylase UbiE